MLKNTAVFNNNKKYFQWRSCFYFALFFLLIFGFSEAIADDTNSFDEMEDDMDFRAIERLSADQPRESIYHPPSYLDR